MEIFKSQSLLWNSRLPILQSSLARQRVRLQTLGAAAVRERQHDGCGSEIYKYTRK